MFPTWRHRYLCAVSGVFLGGGCCFGFFYGAIAPTQSLSPCGPADVRGERELRGRRPEQAVPPGENALPAVRPSQLEPQRLDGPQSGGVWLLLQ